MNNSIRFYGNFAALSQAISQENNFQYVLVELVNALLKRDCTFNLHSKRNISRLYGLTTHYHRLVLI